MSDTITLYDTEFDAEDLREAVEAITDEDNNVGARVGQAGDITVVGDGFADDDMLVSNGVEAIHTSAGEVLDKVRESFVDYLAGALGHADDGDKLQTEGLRYPNEASAEYIHRSTRGTATLGRSFGITMNDLDGARISYIEANKNERGNTALCVGLEDVRDE